VTACQFQSNVRGPILAPVLTEVVRHRCQYEGCSDCLGWMIRPRFSSATGMNPHLLTCNVVENPAAGRSRCPARVNCPFRPEPPPPFFRGAGSGCKAILHGRDPRLAVIVRPLLRSHDLGAARVTRPAIAETQRLINQQLRVVMRFYFEKPRPPSRGLEGA